MFVCVWVCCLSMKRLVGTAVVLRCFKDQIYDIFKCLPPDVQAHAAWGQICEEVQNQNIIEPTSQPHREKSNGK